MNSRIRYLYGVFVLLLLLLIGFTSYWSVFDADSLRANRDNRLPLLQQQQIRRGVIYAGNETIVARNRVSGSGGGRFYSRTYPTASLFSHPVGYSFVDQGSAGLERYYNDELTGEGDEFGNLLDRLRGKRREGDDLITALDADAQRIALAGLAGRAGGVVALDPRTGRVLVMASLPGFDPNAVPEDLAKLNRDPAAPLLNRDTQSGYPPGSTFKVVTATAALDSGKFTADSVLSGRSPQRFQSFPLSNFNNQQFGEITLTQALTNSVNTVWAQVGEEVGADTLYEYMNRYGFNRKPRIDLPRDELRASGLYAPNGKLLSPSNPIDAARVAIGQERLAVTPLQMAEVVAAIANDGRLMRPYIAEKTIDRDGRTAHEYEPSEQSKVMKPTTAATLTDMMKQVVREGTGTAAALAGIDVAGKTGTAEKGDGVNQAWVIAFAPADAPRVAIAVTVERTIGTGGEVAAPIAKQVMETLLAEQG
ncbi:MAG: penicillin-binding transpeptidase domain-containing protein [Solirubrobacterales bacterium]